MQRQSPNYDKLFNFHFYFTQNQPVLNNYIYQFYYKCPSSELKTPSIYNWGKTSRLTYTTFKENDNCHFFGLIEFFHTHRLKTLIKRATSDIPQIEFYGQSEPYFKMVPKLRSLNPNGFHRFNVDPENQKPKFQRSNAKTRNPKKTSKEVMKRQEVRLRKLDPKWIEISVDEVLCAPHSIEKVSKLKPSKSSPNTRAPPVTAGVPSRSSNPRVAKSAAQLRISTLYANDEEPILIPIDSEESDTNSNTSVSEVSLDSTVEYEFDKDLTIFEGLFDDDEYITQEIIDDSGIWV